MTSHLTVVEMVAFHGRYSVIVIESNKKFPARGSGCSDRLWQNWIEERQNTTAAATKRTASIAGRRETPVTAMIGESDSS